MDSQLVARQAEGIYRTKNPDLIKYLARVNQLKAKFAEVTFAHVRREENYTADKLVNETIDESFGKNHH